MEDLKVSFLLLRDVNALRTLHSSIDKVIVEERSDAAHRITSPDELHLPNLAEITLLSSVWLPPKISVIAPCLRSVSYLSDLSELGFLRLLLKQRSVERVDVFLQTKVRFPVVDCLAHVKILWIHSDQNNEHNWRDWCACLLRGSRSLLPNVTSVHFVGPFGAQMKQTMSKGG